MTCVAETIVYFQVAFHKRNTRRACQSAYPRNESVHAHTCNKAQPEPDEDKDFLIEQIDWKSALNRVQVVVFAKSSNTEVTHGDTRETMRLPEVFALD